MKTLRYYLDNEKKTVLRKESGRSVMVYDASSHDAVISIAFDKGEQSSVPMRFGSRVRRADDFDRVYLSHAAQVGQWVELAFLEDGESLEPGGLLVCNPVVRPENHICVTVENLTTAQNVMYIVPDGSDFVLTRLTMKGGPTTRMLVRDSSGTTYHTWQWPTSALAVPESFDGHRVWLGPGFRFAFYGDGGGTSVATVEGYLRKR